MTAPKPGYRDWVAFLHEINHAEPKMGRPTIWLWALMLWAGSLMIDQSELDIEVEKMLRARKGGKRTTPTGKVLSLVSETADPMPTPPASVADQK